jgi:glycosyltransferase involved in cell wall biosynthesis
VNILQWAFPYFPSIGGRERFIERFIVGLKEMGHGVSMVAPMPPTENLKIPELEVVDTFLLHPYLHLFQSRQVEYEKHFCDLLNFIFSQKVNLIHFHNSSSIDVKILERVQQETKLPVVLTLHGPLGLDWQKRLNLIPAPDLTKKFVAISEFVRDQSRQYYSIDPSRIEVIHNGVFTNHLEPNPLGDDFIFFGRLAKEKGIPQLLAAFKLFAEMHEGPNLLIYGDGPERELLKKIIELLDLSNRVHLGDWISDQQREEVLLNARAVIVPSIWQEPFGLVAAEVMAAGRPVIFSNVGALAEVVGEDNECGIEFAPGDIVSLVAALTRLHNDYELATQMGKNAKLRASKKFDFSKMINKYIELFKQVGSSQ